MIQGPKAEIRDGKIFIDGVDQGLELAKHQGLRMTVAGLRKSRTVQMLDGRRLDDTRIRGTGRLEGSLGIVGTDLTVREVEVIVQPAPDGEERLDWLTYVGYSDDDEVPREAPWAIQARLPRDVWAGLIAEFDAGRVQELGLDVQGGMWMKRTPFFYDPRAHLMLAPDGNGGHAMAKATSITWGMGPAAPVTAAESAPPPETTKPAGPSRMLAWCLPAIVVLLAVLVLK